MANPAAHVAALLSAELPTGLPFWVVAESPKVLRLAFVAAADRERYQAALRAEHAPLIESEPPMSIGVCCQDWFGCAEIETVALQVIKVAHHLASGDGSGQIP